MVDALPPPDGHEIPTPAPRASKLTCEHCECVLAPNGDVMKMSDKAKGHLRHEQTIDDLRARLAQLETEAGELRRTVAASAAARESSGLVKGLEL